jgi:OHCU decarboxylase
MDGADRDRDAFVARFGGVWEGSPWVAEAAWERGPFDGPDALHAAMRDAVDRAPHARRLALIHAHPDLGERVAALGADSAREQAAAGLGALDDARRARLIELNAAYRERFGFPFVVCAREHTADWILAAAEARLGNDAATEERIALDEVAKIARLRLDDLLAPR